MGVEGLNGLRPGIRKPPLINKCAASKLHKIMYACTIGSRNASFLVLGEVVGGGGGGGGGGWGQELNLKHLLLNES